MKFQVAEDGTIMTPAETRQLLAPIMPDKEAKMVKADRAGTLAQRHIYYEEHREEILADINTIGSTEARLKWSVPSATWCGLKRRWLNQKAQIEKRRFPSWNENWTDAVKVAWLNAYVQVFGK